MKTTNEDDTLYIGGIYTDTAFHKNRRRHNIVCEPIDVYEYTTKTKLIFFFYSKYFNNYFRYYGFKWYKKKEKNCGQGPVDTVINPLKLSLS